MKDHERRRDYHGNDKIMQDKNGRYVDDYADNYHRSKDQIQRALDEPSSSSFRGYTSDYFGRHADDFGSHVRDEYRSDGGHDDYVPHLSEEEWLLKQKKEQKNLEELTAKEKELEVASKDVIAAQDSLAVEKQKIDAEINQKMKEMENMKREFESKEGARIEAERRAAEERQKIENMEREKEKQRRQAQLRETEIIE